MYCASCIFWVTHCQGMASAEMTWSAVVKRRKERRCAPGVIKEMREEGHEPEASTLATLAVAAVQDHTFNLNFRLPAQVSDTPLCAWPGSDKLEFDAVT